MHSGRGEEASEGTYRPLPIPREPHVPVVAEAREGVVLPAPGESWEQQATAVQPAPGEPWGAQGPHAPAQPQLPPAADDSEATRLMAPYGQQPPVHGSDGERTQLLAPYGQQPAAPGSDGEKTQLLAPYGQPPAAPGSDGERTQLLAPYQQPQAEAADAARQARQPLPPEQQFHAPVPPLPSAAPAPAAPPPMPTAAPFAIRPGTPGDQPHVDSARPTQSLPPAQPVQQFAAEEQGPAGATQQLPPFGQAAAPAPGPQNAQPAQDDYDYLYRKEGEPAPPHATAFGQPGRQPYGRPQAQQPPAAQAQHGQQPPYGTGGGPVPQNRRKKLSPAALIGIGVAVLAAVGIAAGAALSGGSGSDQQNAGATAPASGAPGSSGGADTAAGQAKQLDALLATSNSSRSTVINSVEAIRTCGNAAQAGSDLRAAAGQRDGLVTKLSGMKLDKLPNHDELVAQLTTAWKASAAADNHYAAWADQVAGDKNACKRGHAKMTAETAKANASSGEATIAKKQAAGLWNPLAQQYGLTQRQYTQL